MPASSPTTATAHDPATLGHALGSGAQVRIEAAALQRALEGDGRAFASLVRPHLPTLHRVALRACGDETLAEDAVQETLTLAYERLDRYRAGTSLKGFLATIAVKRAHSLLRSERRRRDRELGSSRPAMPAAADAQLDAERAAERVRQALAAMPEKRREIAMLRLDGGLSYAEIADAADTSAGSARVLVHKALAELRALLSDLLEGDDSREGGRR